MNTDLLISPPAQVVDDEIVARVQRLLLRALGGPGSGNFGHAGRPGEVGGSAPDEGGGGGAQVGRTYAEKLADKQRFYELKSEWARVNNDLLEHLDTPDSAAARAHCDTLKGIVKDMYRLDCDPGGLEGIGLPGGPRDVVVVGAGPGGMAVGIMAGTEGLDTLVIDTKPGGQPRSSSRIENYPGFPIGVAGDELAGRFRLQAERVGAEIKTDTHVIGMSVDPMTGLKTLMLSNGERIEARSVVLAGGLEVRKLDMPGADHPSVVYDAKQLAANGTGKAVVVLGGSNGAAQAALGAARTAEHVTLVARSPIASSMSDYQISALANNKRITVIQGDTATGLKNGTLTLASGVQLPAHAVGVFIGSQPATKWVAGIGLELKQGRVVTNDALETNVPGVFAVGDIRHNGGGRIGMAVGDGQNATHSVFQYFGKLKATQPEAFRVPKFKQPAAPKPSSVPLAHRVPETPPWFPTHDPRNPLGPRPAMQLPAALRLNKVSDKALWFELLDDTFELDKANPWFGQTVEPEDTRYEALGGQGSGNFGHAGRPGEVGGSSDTNLSVQNFGVYDLRHRSTASLVGERDVLVKDVKENPRHADYHTERIADYNKEIAFRAEWNARQTTHPHEVADVTGLYNVRPDSLRENSTLLKADNVEYGVGRGVGYSPIPVGDESHPFVMLDGKITIGPRAELGKDVSEVLPAMAALRARYDDVVHVANPGDFAKVGTDVEGSELGRVLYGYKSPLLSTTYEPMLHTLAAAYLTNGKIVPTEQGDPVASARRSFAEMDAREPGWRERYPSIAAEATDQHEALTMLRHLSMGTIAKDAVSQATVNDFALTVKATQEALTKRYPSGTVTLYRGVQGEYAKNLKAALAKSDSVEMQMHPATSWSESRAEAAKFAGRSGVTIARRVPIDDVLFHWRVSSNLSARAYIFGGVEEQEVLVGSRTPTMRITRKDVK